MVDRLSDVSVSFTVICRSNTFFRFFLNILILKVNVVIQYKIGT